MEKIITALKAQKANQDRINVYLDGSFAFGVSKFVGLGLKVGQKLDPHEINRLTDLDNREKAYQYALGYIRFKPRSCHDLTVKLKEKGYPESIIASVIGEFSEKKYIDDREYAVQWVETRAVSHPRSRRMLKYELLNKGISTQDIEVAIENAPNDYDLAMFLAEKNLHKFSSLNKEEFKKKIWGFLSRKAFGSFEIKKVIDDLLETKFKDETE